MFLISCCGERKVLKVQLKTPRRCVLVMCVHLAACRADAELRVVGLDLFVQDVVSSDLLLQVGHGGAVLLHVHQFLSAQTPEEYS